MAKLDYAAAYKIIRVYEGGNVDDPQDPGGRTSRGCTQTTDNAYRARHGEPKIDVYKETEDNIAAIFKEGYWDKMHCDELLAGVDLEIFDACINSGPGNATKWAQAQLGLEVDGNFGAKTLQSLRGINDAEEFINGFCSRRLATLKGSKNWKRYGKGWGARIANCKKIGAAWATGDTPPPVAVVEHIGGHRKVITADLNTAPTHAAPIAVGTVGSIGAAASQAAGSVEALKDIAPIMLWCFIGLTILGVAATMLVKVLQDRQAARNAGGVLAPVLDTLDAGLPSIQVAAPPTEAAAVTVAPMPAPIVAPIAAPSPAAIVAASQASAAVSMPS